jgi:hypothetical protein
MQDKMKHDLSTVCSVTTTATIQINNGNGKEKNIYTCWNFGSQTKKVALNFT